MKKKNAMYLFYSPIKKYVCILIPAEKSGPCFSFLFSSFSSFFFSIEEKEIGWNISIINLTCFVLTQRLFSQNTSFANIA